MLEQHLDKRGIALGATVVVALIGLGIYSVFSDGQKSDSSLSRVTDLALSSPTDQITLIPIPEEEQNNASQISMVCQKINRKNPTASEALAKLRKETGFKGKSVIFCADTCKPIKTGNLPRLVRTGNRICTP